MITEARYRGLGIVSLIALLIGAVTLCYGQVPHTGNLHSSRVVTAFAKVVPELRRRTSVPLRLPTRIPALEDEQELYAIATAIEKDRYIIVLAATPDCEGQHVCAFGTVIGSSRPLGDLDEYEMNGPWTTVKLAHGIKGQFRASTCAAYCNDSLLSWTEGQYHYIIGMKAEKKPALIAIGNSAMRDSW